MKIPILDHGYLMFVDAWGTGIDGQMAKDFEVGIIEAARMSTAKGFRQWAAYHECTQCLDSWLPMNIDDPLDRRTCPVCGLAMICKLRGDGGLLAYLSDNKHSTPFEMAGMVIEVQAPIMVFREWHRHRTQSYNEMSGRYIPLPDVNYVPTVERLLINSKTNKQAGTVKGAAELTEEDSAEYQRELDWVWKAQEAFYQRWLKRGVPKELARVHIGVGRYSRMRACANLRNWLAFLTLRMDEKAQWEIRQYANAVGGIIAEKFPKTWGLFMNSRTKKEN